jgi:trk system potassium uptake protein TrkA
MNQVNSQLCALPHAARSERIMPNRNANILLLGLGGVGYYLAQRLTHEGHAITAIEANSDLIRRADGDVDARLVWGDAMSFSCWEDAGAEHMDYLIAVTDNDAVNILSSLLADRSGIPRKIARVRSLDLLQPGALLTASDLKIDLIIRPEELAAREIARLLKIRAGNVVIDIADGRMQVMATRIGGDSAMANTKLKDISQKYNEFYFRIVSIARGINTIIPGGDDEILPGDHVYVLAYTTDLPRLMELTGVPLERRHSVMIIGGGLVGRRAAELLEDSFPVKLIERDPRRAEELSYQLEKTEILNGDGSDADTLIKAGLRDVDVIITATGENETNIMTSVLAKHLIQDQLTASSPQQGRTIALVKREEYLVLAATMGSDIVLNKKVLAGNEILKYIRLGKLLSVAQLHGCDTEVVELVADAGAPITRKPLYQLTGMKEKIIIGAVYRDGTWEIAVGDTHIRPGDKIIGICKSRHLRDLQSLLLS